MTPSPTRADVLGFTPNVAKTPADFLVDWQGPTGSVPTLMAAIDAAIRSGRQNRCVIEIAPGVYEGPAYVPPTAPPLTIRGKGDVSLVAGIDAIMPGAEYRQRFGHLFEGLSPILQARLALISARQRITTANSAVLTIARDGCTVSGLAIRNLYQCDRPEAAPAGAVGDVAGRFAQGQHQAVALMVEGADQVFLKDLRLSSYQDTLYLRGTGNRVGIQACQIEGDVDYIFGGATAWFEQCEVRTRCDRAAASWVTAPSTDIHQPYGFVFDQCRFTYCDDPGGLHGAHFLGRQWFEGVRASPYWDATKVRLGPVNDSAGFITQATLEAVGKCHLVGCELGDHLDRLNPWDCWGGTPADKRFRPVQQGPGVFLKALGEWPGRNGLTYGSVADAPDWLSVRPA